MVARGLEREGFILQALLSGGIPIQSGTPNNNCVTGTEEETSCHAGTSCARRSSSKVSPGSTSKNVTVPYDPSSRLHGTSVGARAAVNLWFEPTPSTMIAADAALTSIATGYSARAAYGWKLKDWFYLGPEAQTFACTGYSQLRFGAHMTGLKTGQFEWSAAAGWSQDSDRRSSPYLRLGVLTRR